MSFLVSIIGWLFIQPALPSR